MLGFTPHSFPPRKRGPRNRSGAAVTERTSAQWVLRRHDARVHSSFVSPAKAGAQGPRWCRCHCTNLSAVGSPPARCSGSLEKTAPSLPQSPWRPDVLLAATQCSVVPGSRRSPGKRGGRKAGAQGPRWCRCHGADLSAAGSPPARCSGSLEKQHALCRGGCGGSMSFWPPPSARWSLAPGVRRENEGRVGKRRAQEPRWCRCRRNGPQRSGYSAGTMLRLS